MTNEALSDAGLMKAHVKTYTGFIRMAKVGTVLTAIVAAAVIFIIAS